MSTEEFRKNVSRLGRKFARQQDFEDCTKSAASMIIICRLLPLEMMY